MGHVTLAVERSGTVIADILFASESKSGDRFTFSGIKFSFFESVIKSAHPHRFRRRCALFAVNTNPKQCFTKNTEFGCEWLSGDDGSRTRVQKPIPRSSTIIVGCLTFPLPRGSGRPHGFGSFILRPYVQSLAQVVSHKVDARIPKCECSGADGKPLGCVC